AGGQGADRLSRRQGGAAKARRDEALDGSAHPSLQALHRGLSRSGRRGLRRGRGAEGRVRRLFDRRRHQQALSLQDPRSRLRPSAGDGLHLPWSHARRRRSNPRFTRYRLWRGRPLMAVRRLAEKQPASFAFSEENLAWARKEIAKYPPGRQASAVIALLWRAQDQEGWVTEPAIRVIAELLGMATIRVLEVATFYTMSHLSPVGAKAHIQVCGTTPCWLR